MSPANIPPCPPLAHCPTPRELSPQSPMAYIQVAPSYALYLIPPQALCIPLLQPVLSKAEQL